MYNGFYRMIKKIIPLGLVFILALGVLFVSIHTTTANARQSLASTSLKFTVQPVPSPEATVSSSPKVNYFLAYPGILPDNPLYRLKMVRDRIWEWLTTGRLEKANLFLLYADKRLGAGKALIEGNKMDLGFSTLLKGEKYLERAIGEAEKAMEEGRKVETLVGRLKNASLKHEEVLLELKEKLTAEGETAVDDLLKFVKTLQEKAAKI